MTILNKNITSLLLLSGLLLMFLLGGCASPTTRRVRVNQELIEKEMKIQRRIALESQFKAQRRLMHVSYPILKASAPLCDDNIRSSLGLIFANKHTFDTEFRDAAIETFEMEDALKVVQVLPDSPGEQAGVLDGDILVSLNGKPIPTGDGATKQFFRMMNEEMAVGAPMEISFKREGVEMVRDIVPVEVCGFLVVVVQRHDINAYADGQKVAVTRGMMRFTENDQELAMVVAHEVAHNAMNHGDAINQNYWLGTIVDILAAAYGINTQGAFGGMSARAYSQEFEAEADYVGLYILARTGLEIDNVAMFWRRMAAENPENISKSLMASHPSTPERFVAIEKTVEEIKEKIVAGQPLLPEYKQEP